MCILHKDAVAAVLAAPHDEIGDYRMLAVGMFSNHDTAPGIAVVLQKLFQMGSSPPLCRAQGQPRCGDTPTAL